MLNWLVTTTHGQNTHWTWNLEKADSEVREAAIGCCCIDSHSGQLSPSPEPNPAKGITWRCNLSNSRDKKIGELLFFSLNEETLALSNIFSRTNGNQTFPVCIGQNQKACFFLKERNEEDFIIPAWISGKRGTSQEEARSNCDLAYRWLNTREFKPGRVRVKHLKL